MQKNIESNGKAVAYLRLSTVKGEGGDRGQETIETQRNRCIETALRAGLEIVDEYNEGQGMSAFKAGNRPEWDRMLVELEPGTAVIGWATSRISRNHEESWHDIEKAGGIVLTNEGGTSETMAGRQALDYKWIADMHYSQQISHAVREGHYRSKMAGRHLGRRPFGYDQEKAVLTLNIEEATLLRNVAKNIIKGASLRSESIRLSEEGVKTVRGATNWTPTTLSRLMQAPMMVGLAELPDGTMKQIVDETVLDPATWQEVKNAIAKRRRHNGSMERSSVGPKPQSLLSGIATCLCGKGMGSGNTEVAYRCNDRATGVCEVGAHNQKRGTDAYIVQALYSFCTSLLEDGNEEKLAELGKIWGTTTDQATIAEQRRLEGEIAVCDTSIETLAETLAASDPVAFAAGVKAISSKRANFQSQLDTLEIDETPVTWVALIAQALEDTANDLAHFQEIETHIQIKEKSDHGQCQLRLVEEFIKVTGGLDEAREILKAAFARITCKPAPKAYASFIDVERTEYELAV
ncbi:MAG: hypothetical protein CME21_00010 [Gemmatimonadetes bacterium]|nr:hypothetical protein [Gemmatimonadota bacterium]